MLRQNTPQLSLVFLASNTDYTRLRHLTSAKTVIRRFPLLMMPALA